MIDEYAFGRIVVEGRRYADDIKIIQGRIISEWWRKSGHTVEIDDVKDLLNPKPDILVIGKGEPGLMRSAASLRAWLDENHVQLIEERTSRAVETFNRLRKEGKNISAGFHLTC